MKQTEKFNLTEIKYKTRRFEDEIDSFPPMPPLLFYVPKQHSLIILAV